MELEKANIVFKKIYEILDKKYFHVCVSTKENDIVEWDIYYSNLNYDDFFSSNNKPLLSSKTNTFDDIYKLRDKFEKEKEKACTISADICKESFERYKVINDIFNYGHNTMLNLISSYQILFCVYLTIRNNYDIFNVIYFVIFTLISLIFYFYYHNKIKKMKEVKIEEAEEETKRIYIKSLGFKFMEALK